MEIKMPITFRGNYLVVTRSGGSESRGRCQQLNVRELAPKKEPGAGEAQSEADLPTHQIVFYAFGCKRIVEGRLKENHEDRVVFQVQEKEYEFSSAGPSLP